MSTSWPEFPRYDCAHFAFACHFTPLTSECENSLDKLKVNRCGRGTFRRLIASSIRTANVPFFFDGSHGTFSWSSYFTMTRGPRLGKFRSVQDYQR